MTTMKQYLQENGLADGALAAMADHQVAELDDPVAEGAVICPLTMRQEEGRRIYERSLRFVMLLAVHELYPGQRVRIEFSAGHGIYIRLPGRILDGMELAALEQRMHEIAQADLPYRKEIWPLERVKAYFEAEGQQDKLDLLQYRAVQTMTMYGVRHGEAEMWEYFYGAMTPSTGYVRVFRLEAYKKGFIMYLPEAASPETPAPSVDRPKHMAIFRQSTEWCRILGVENAADLSRMAEQKQLRNFIRVNEALHDEAISDIARDIVSRGNRAVMIAGPSSSGKTTFAGRLAVHLQVQGHRSWRLSMDDYYLNRVQIPKEPDGSVDLEAITTLDLPLLQAHIRALLAGETVPIPRYNFQKGEREPEGVLLTLGPDDILVVEGIHGLNPMFCDGLPQQLLYRVFVSALTCLNLDDHNRIRTTDVRLLRRIVRDNQFRGTSPESTLSMWGSVRRGEEKWIFPYQEQADRMFNTALQYELPILAYFARPLLRQIPETSECWVMASRLRKMLNYMPALDESIFAEIPPLSLLREFIGGCTIEEA